MARRSGIGRCGSVSPHWARRSCVSLASTDCNGPVIDETGNHWNRVGCPPIQAFVFEVSAIDRDLQHPPAGQSIGMNYR